MAQPCSQLFLLFLAQPGLSQHRQPCLQPTPGLHSYRGGGPSATGSTERTVGRPLWGKDLQAPQRLPRIRPVIAMLWAPSPRAVVRRKPAPQRGQKNVCGARPQFQTTRTFLRPHPPKKEPFPQESTFLAQETSPFPPSYHGPGGRERRHGQGEAESVLGTPGPWARCHKERRLFKGLSLLPTGFYRCPLLTFPQKNDSNLPSNKNKYVCLFLDTTALGWPGFGQD